MIELMTIGYESLSRSEFFGILERCRVTLLVDIRELPISRKPGFNKAALEGTLVKRGLKYEHVFELGCPRDIRHEYRADGDWARYAKRFKAYLDGQTEAIDRVMNADERYAALTKFSAFVKFAVNAGISQRVFERGPTVGIPRRPRV